jgi:bacteriorhodopsin
MDLQDLFHWLYAVSMALGALLFWNWSRNPRGVPQYEYLVAIFIPVWSGLAYTAMAFDQGKVEVAGQITHYARYLDWIITTPLLLLALAWTAMHTIHYSKTLMAALMGTDAIMILCGLVADLSIGIERYFWYLAGCFAFFIVLWIIWIPLKAKARSQDANLYNLYNKLAAYLTVLWIGYPTVWIIGPSGLGLINQTVDVFLFCVLPFFSKVGFTYLDLQGLRRLGYTSPHVTKANSSWTA